MREQQWPAGFLRLVAALEQGSVIEMIRRGSSGVIK